MKYLYRLKAKAGFSLVECMVAILVFSIMSMLIVMLLNAALIQHRNNLRETRSIREQKEVMADRNGIGRILRPGSSDSIVAFDFGVPSIISAAINYNLTAHIVDPDLPDTMDRGLEISSVAPAGSTKVFSDVPSMYISQSMVGSHGESLVDILISSPGTVGGVTPSGNLHPAGLPDRKGVGHIYRRGTAPNFTYACVLRVTVTFDQRNGGAVCACSVGSCTCPAGVALDWMAINIVGNVTGLDNNTNPDIIFRAATTAAPTHNGLQLPGLVDAADMEVQLADGSVAQFHQIILVKPPGTDSRRVYNFAVTTTDEVLAIPQWLNL